jgi:hypothetical protein
MDHFIEVADSINNKISAILTNALSGYEQKYWLNGAYIRWGLVEKDIHRAVCIGLGIDEEETP